MSKIAEKKALEAYPKAPSPYYDDHILDRNVNCRAGYIKGYGQAIQDFMEKAEKWMRYEWSNKAVADLMFNSFKKYLQDEN